MPAFLLAADVPSNIGLQATLSVMMFLEFAIWGSWIVVLGNYLNALGFSRKEIARVYATMPIGSIIAPMFIGTIADRYIPSQYVMAVSHLLGGVLMFWLAQVREPRKFFFVALAYAIVYSPTLSLVNAIFFNAPGANDFGAIRVFGTIGWICAGLSLKLFIKEGQPVNNRPLLLAAALSVVLGLFSFALPYTKPGSERALDEHKAKIAELNKQRDEKTIDEPTFQAEHKKAELSLETAQGIPFLKAFAMFGDPQAAVFFTGSLVVAMAMAIYFAFGALYIEQGAKIAPQNVGPVMTLGQFVEIFFLFTLTWFIDNLGMRNVLLIGVGAWALRFAIFSGPPIVPLVLLGVALHGICFDFYFGAGFVHTANIAPPGITASAQSLFGVLVYGLGMYLGTELAGWLNQKNTVQSIDPQTGNMVHVTDWRKFWLIPCIGVITALVVFFFIFKG